MKLDNRYYYKAIVVKVYDGDTITVDVDLGFSVILKGIKVRLSGIDTAELRSKNKEQKAKAYAARDMLRDLCLQKQVFFNSLGLDKYGRWLGEIFTLEGLSCNEELLKSGLAVAYDGGKKISIILEKS
jgi:micrococcal nuclease